MTSARIVIEALNAAANGLEPIVVCTGVGSHQSWVCRYFEFDYPRRRLLTSAGHGTMGTAIPYACGAQMAEPDAMVICIEGDGSANMDIVHLMTVAEYQLPIKVVVLDNGAMGIVNQFEELQGYAHVATADRLNPDFADIAKACGCLAWNADETVGWGLEEWSAFLDLEAPALAHVDVDGIGVWPLLEAGRMPGEMTDGLTSS